MHLYIYTHAIISLLSIAELSYAYRMARDAHHGHAHTRGPAAGVEMICFLSVHLPFGRNIVRRGFAMLHVGPLDRRQRGRRNLLSVCPCGNQATDGEGGGTRPAGGVGVSLSLSPASCYPLAR